MKGWKSSAGWGFPKGKINEQEPRPRCAAREVWLSFLAARPWLTSPLIGSGGDWLRFGRPNRTRGCYRIVYQRTVNLSIYCSRSSGRLSFQDQDTKGDQRMFGCLFISTLRSFSMQKIAWFRLSDLPTWKRSKSVPGKFYLISPFIG